MSDRPIRRALIAVYDKTGIVDFARALVDEFGVEILSTGGTAKHLMDAGIPVTLVETVTGFPEMLDGRVKTLHPHIHAGILADRDNPEHMRQLAEHGIRPIDMVVVNLYPFEKTVADPNCTFEQAIEMIDIGGPCLLRAAAKNHKHVLVVTTGDYSGILTVLRGGREIQSLREHRSSAAFLAFAETSEYDTRVWQWLGNKNPDGSPIHFATRFMCEAELRYGENPGLKARLLVDWDGGRGPGLVRGVVPAKDEYEHEAQSKLSYNNFVDADAALALCAELTRAKGALWHRFVTGDLCHRFPTGGPSLKPQTPAPVQESRTVAPRIDNEHLSQRNLPHIQRPEATYFITFRIRQGELSPAERDIVLNACRHWHQEKMTLHAVVVMPDHVHLLLTPHEIEPGRWIALGELLHSIKRHSANEINRLRGVSGALWLDESFDRVVRNEAEFVEKRAYIVANPVTAELCADEVKYAWTWTSDTGFMEAVGKTNDRLETGRTEHRLQTGATNPRLQTGVTGHRLETGATVSAERGPDDPTLKLASVCFIKHTNACGVGVADDAIEAYRAAYLGDPNAAMGGVLAVNVAVTKAFAEVVMETYDRFGKSAGAGGFFVEVWVAPSFDEDAVDLIRTRKKWGANVRLLTVGDMAAEPDPTLLEYKTIAGGFLVQTPDVLGLNEADWKVVTKRAPTDVEMADLRLAWLIAKHTKSNAISLCKDGMLIGSGAGQMSRVMSCRIATWLARENGHAEKLPGAAAASDAFFPFKDGPDILLDAGVTAIIQPGGSKRDEEVITACDARGAAMIFTGTRHFKH